MALEDKIDALIAALKENTAAHKAGGAASSAPAEDGDTGADTPAATGRGRGRPAKPAAATPPPPAEPEAPTVTSEDVKDVAMKLLNVLGKADTQKLIKKHGADKLVDLAADKFAAFHAEAAKMLEDAGDDSI